MELRQLRYFVFLAEELHFGRAASRLQIATPTLSQQIATLERSLELRLVERTSHAVSLTPAGEALLGEARLVLAAAERARAAAKNVGRTSRTLNIRIATGLQAILGEEFPALENHPALDINLLVSNTMDAELAVLHGVADAAFVWGPPRQDGALRSIPIIAAPVSLAMPAGHRLAHLHVVPVNELRDESIALFPRELAPGVYDRLVHHLLPGGLARPGQLLYERMRMNLSEAMLRAVAEERAIAPYVHVIAVQETHNLASELVLRPLEPPLNLDIELLWREPTRPHLQKLIDQLRLEPPGSEASPSG